MFSLRKYKMFSLTWLGKGWVKIMCIGVVRVCAYVCDDSVPSLLLCQAAPWISFDCFESPTHTVTRHGKFIKLFYNKHKSPCHPRNPEEILRPWLNCNIHWLHYVAVFCICTCKWGCLAHRCKMMCSNVHSYFICIILMRQLPGYRQSKVDYVSEQSWCLFKKWPNMRKITFIHLYI